MKNKLLTANAIVILTAAMLFTGCSGNQSTSSAQTSSASVSAENTAASGIAADTTGSASADKTSAAEAGTTSDNTGASSQTTEGTSTAETSGTAGSTTGSSAEALAATIAQTAVTNGAVDTSDLFTTRDLTQTPDTSSAVTYTLTSNEDITITSEGTYIITGTAENATVFVDADDNAKVQLVLDSVSITNTDAPCIYVKNADKVFISTISGESALTVTGSFSTADTADAVIFSRDDLVLNGTGTLTISSSDKGIVAKDDLKITGGTYNITATSSAIRANDSILIADGSFTIKAGSDGLHAENSDDTTEGYIYICDGETAPETEPTYSTTAANYQVTITAADLNMRTGPGTSYDTMGYVKPGTYTINAESNGWGRLSTNGYWVSLSYTTKLNNTQQTDPSETTSTTTTAPTTTKPAATTTTSASKYQIKVSISDLNMRTGPGTSYKSKGHIKKGTYDVTQEKNGWAKIKTNGYWVSLKYVTKITKATTKATTTTSTTKATSATTTQKATTKATSASQSATTAASGKFNVKVTASNLVMRSGAGTKYKNKGTLKKGKVCTIKKVKNGWGQIAGNGYWVKLKYTKLSGTANVKVTAKDLNMRKGAGTQYKSVGHVKKGTHKIKAMKNGWVQLASNGYWVSLSYVKLV